MNLNQIDQTKLRKLISKSFNLGELRLLCTDLGVDYESLAGETRELKTQELIEYSERHGKLDDLFRLLKKERPDVNWSIVIILNESIPYQEYVQDPSIHSETTTENKSYKIFGVTILEVKKDTNTEKRSYELFGITSLHLGNKLIYVIGAISIFSVFLVALLFIWRDNQNHISDASFDYIVKIQDSSGVPIKNAKVTIDVAGKLSITEYSDSNGVVTLPIDNLYVNTIGRIVVEASGYLISINNITIVRDQLPGQIRLTAVPPSITVTANFTPVPSVTTPPDPTNTSTSTSTLIPTDISTPTKTATPTLTPTLPNPVNCEHRIIARRVFPQLSEIIQFSFIGPKDNENFDCLGVYDRVHSLEELDVAIFFEFEAINNGFAYFGMSVPNSYDVTEFSELCFWAFAEEPNQAFELQLKDSEERIASQIIFHENVNEWQEHCVSINEFGSVNLESIIDFSVGFNQGLGNVAIWLDDFELK